ncbi:hypothetical protein LOTGIDRAFT_237846 [Lottia gigantea]|uniref:FAS1 domain-containing protein n=1 Tax=Lottia gigantea TaxID=225164 RepID=V4AYK1_LOTGI|nr:hypothetical protein LOTGIDRAFT_237846 [Lottia gigantea]ESP02703.1 hypothetical protein LOTGIDRAFT_237846 [Lottia gigantea]
MDLCVLFVFIIYLSYHKTYSGLPPHLRKYARGPNVCVEQEVYGTRERFFTQCVGRYLRTICERPTMFKFECCSGFEKVRGKQGCTGIKPLKNLVETLQDLELTEFSNVIGQSGVEDQLANQGAYTVFAPSEDAIQQLSIPEQQALLSRTADGTPNVFYHVAPGRLNFTGFKKNSDYVTLYKDEKISVQKYSYGVATVNCARVTKANEMATNGIVHVIDKVLSPLDNQRDLAEKVFGDDQFSQFQLALFVADMVKTLKNKQHLTVFAPTNQAFAKLPNDMLDRILQDSETAKKVIEHHIVKGVYCSDSVIIALGLKTLDGTRLLFRCKRSGKYIGNAKLEQMDIVGRNGVIHAIDNVLIPDSVKTVVDMADDLDINDLVNYARNANLTGSLTDGEDYTLLAPTDKAFKKLPAGYRAALRTQPLAVGKLLEYHKLKGKITSNDMIGNHSLYHGDNATISAKIQVNVFRNGNVVVGGAKVEKSDTYCKSGVVHTIDKVLIPEEGSIMDTIITDPNLSTLRLAIEKAGLSEMLTKPYGQFTMIAPTNRAFKSLGSWEKKAFEKLTPGELKEFLERHIINRMVLKCGFSPNSVYSIKSRQGDSVIFTQTRSGSVHINKKYRVQHREEIMANNGVLYKINNILKCSCEPRIRSRR